MVSRIQIATKGKIRNKPLSKRYLQQLEAVLEATDPRLGFVITSGAQAKKGTKGKRIGGTRHDVGEHGVGETADGYLTLDGKQILPGDRKAKPYYSAFFQNAATVFPGIGHYSWGVHVGGGSRAAWGPDKTSKSLDPDYAKVIRAGWKGAKTGVGRVQDILASMTGSSSEASASPDNKHVSGGAGVSPSSPNDLFGSLINEIMMSQQQGGTAELAGAEKQAAGSKVSAELESLLASLGMPTQGAEAGVERTHRGADVSESLDKSIAPGGSTGSDDISDGMAMLAGLGTLFTQFLQGFDSKDDSLSAASSLMGSGIQHSPSVAQILARTGMR